MFPRDLISFCHRAPSHVKLCHLLPQRPLDILPLDHWWSLERDTWWDCWSLLPHLRKDDFHAYMSRHQNLSRDLDSKGPHGPDCKLNAAIGDVSAQVPMTLISSGCLAYSGKCCDLLIMPGFGLHRGRASRPMSQVLAHLGLDRGTLLMTTDELDVSFSRGQGCTAMTDCLHTLKWESVPWGCPRGQGVIYHSSV